MPRLFTFFTLLYFASQILGQEPVNFTFANNRNFLITAGIDPDDVKENPLGNEVAEKLVLLKDRYTYVQPAGPTSPVEKTIISKPVIYNSIQKLNRYFKKSLKDDKIDVETARNNMLLCLDIALIIFSEDTSSFESYLSKMSKPEDILAAYKLVVLQ
jgi:hypothetical protein